MRVIGGTARGKTLIAPEGLNTRPTSDRAREAMFNILMARIAGARVLDLFAGSGALSAEALSRGAHSVTSVDISPKACAVIRRNLNLKGISGTAKVIQGDWLQTIGMLQDRFDIVFLDPPYRMSEVYGQVFTELVRRNLLAEDAVVVMECEHGQTIILPQNADVFDERKYGRAGIKLVRQKRED